jgi:hypothetical protein
MGTEFRAYKPETITRTLVNLRTSLIRDGGPGLEHVEALLALRGHNLGPVPRRIDRQHKRNGLRRKILAALRSGPLRGVEIARHVATDYPDKPLRRVCWGVNVTLRRMETAGLVRREGGAWVAR